MDEKHFDLHMKDSTGKHEMIQGFLIIDEDDSLLFDCYKLKNMKTKFDSIR